MQRERQEEKQKLDHEFNRITNKRLKDFLPQKENYARLRGEGKPEKFCRGCTCKHTQCLSMYCICFKRKGFCGPDCGCNKTGEEKCENDAEHPLNEKKFVKVKAQLKSDPEAWEKENGEKGCNCEKNKC